VAEGVGSAAMKCQGPATPGCFVFERNLPRLLLFENKTIGLRPLFLAKPDYSRPSGAAMIYFLPKTSLSSAVVWAAGFLRIFCSSCPSI
jgi:hypothetical protein